MMRAELGDSGYSRGGRGKAVMGCSSGVRDEQGSDQRRRGDCRFEGLEGSVGYWAIRWSSDTRRGVADVSVRVGGCFVAAVEDGECFGAEVGVGAVTAGQRVVACSEVLLSGISFVFEASETLVPTPSSSACTDSLASLTNFTILRALFVRV